MIKEGQQKKAKYWGEFTVKKVAQLKAPEIAHSAEVGKALFNYTLVQRQWKADGGYNFWFPYWVTIKGKERFGQYAPMMGEDSLLELLREAIRKEFFSKNFLNQLHQTIIDKLNCK